MLDEIRKSGFIDKFMKSEISRKKRKRRKSDSVLQGVIQRAGFERDNRINFEP